MSAQQNRSGNKNDASSFPVAATQAERAAGFRNTLEALLRLHYVVGADWFRYYDEPEFGRFDGENYDFGLVDIHDQPYESLTMAAAQALHPMAIKSEMAMDPAPAVRDAGQGAPPAPREPLGHFTIRLALSDWDHERGFVKPASKFPVADLYVCWSQKAVYLGLYAQDFVEADYYRNKIVPAADRAQWIISIKEKNKPIPIYVRLGPGGPPTCDEPGVSIVNDSGDYMNTRNIAAVELPATLFGKTGFKPGDTIQFDSTYFTQARADCVEWKGKFDLRE